MLRNEEKFEVEEEVFKPAPVMAEPVVEELEE